MSMNATESAPRLSATFFATVDLPLPDPPAMPMMRGFDTCGIYWCGCVVAFGGVIVGLRELVKNLSGKVFEEPLLTDWS